MNSSQLPSPSVIIEDLDPVKLKGKPIFPRLPSFSSFKNPLVGIPIAQRLVFGFLIPALIASFAAGLIGIQSVQLLNQESNFYQNLFQGYSSLTTGNDFLQLMNFKLDTTLADAQGNNPSHDQIASDQKAVQELETRYDTLLQDYVQHNLLIYDPSRAALFDEAGHPGQGAQQSLLASSAVRTWHLYRSTQDQILQEVQNGHYSDAQTLEQNQGQVTYSDALSALRQLIQFDGRLTTYVQDAIAVQQTSGLITTLISVILVLSAIGVIGWLIYGTLVGRLRQLQSVAQAVQRGQTDTRVAVDGRDEITDVSNSFNTMLDTIVGLLEQTRVQRDALTSTAERLFSDLRLANGGEFDVKTAVNNDPIWMLSHAFNFTIGRFRRFLMRQQSTIEQLDIVSQQGIDNANAFLTHIRKLLGNAASSPSISLSGHSNAVKKDDKGGLASNNTDNLTPAQVRELARLAEGFAREVTGLAQTVRRVTGEMRASLAPFRLEASQNSQQANPISEAGIQRRPSRPINNMDARSQQGNPISEMGMRHQQPDPPTDMGVRYQQPNPITDVSTRY